MENVKKGQYLYNAQRGNIVKFRDRRKNLTGTIKDIIDNPDYSRDLIIDVDGKIYKKNSRMCSLLKLPSKVRKEREWYKNHPEDEFRYIYD
jgi:hypothetical protein